MTATSQSPVSTTSLLQSPERREMSDSFGRRPGPRNASTFEGWEITFDEDGRIAGCGILSWITWLFQVLTKLVLFLFSPRQLIKIVQQFNTSWQHCVFYFPEDKCDSCVALTFDDAPGQQSSLCDKVLDLLDEYNAKATFFITSNYVTLNEKNERDCADMCKRGHELGNHMPEDKPYDKLGQAEFAFELKETEKCLNEVKGRAAPAQEAPSAGAASAASAHHKWFRPPCARLTRTMIATLEDTGYKVALGDVFANDVLIQDVAWMRGIFERHVRAGSIVVIHAPDADFRSKNLRETEALLQVLRAKGLRAVTLSQLHDKCHSTQ